MAKDYDYLKGLDPKHNAFHLGHNHFTTMHFGYLYPIAWFECVPGDYYDLDIQALIRCQPLIAPIMNNITCEVDVFFVPTRLLWDDFERFITTVDDRTIPPSEYQGDQPVWCNNNNDDSIPIVIPEPTFYDHLKSLLKSQGITKPSEEDINNAWKQYKVYHNLDEVPIDKYAPSLWNVLGFSPSFPSGVDQKFDNSVLPLDWLRRMFYFIYNEWYRDENLQRPIDFKATTGPDSTLALCLRSAWHKDYFTASFYDRQKGVPPALPVTGLGNVIFNKSLDSGTSSNHLPGPDMVYDSAADNGQHLRAGMPSTSTWNPLGVDLGAFPAGTTSRDVAMYYSKSRGDAFVDWLTNNNKLDTSQLISFNVSDARDMFAIQRFYEALMRGGSRYIEFLQYQFGVSPTDARLSIPERIGGMAFNIQISEVLQNSASPTADQEGTPQGTQAGHGFGFTDRGGIGTYHAVEFGYIMFIARIRPPAVYSQRMPREMMRKSLLEQFSPYFVNLSYQAIMLGELYATGNSSNVNGDFKIFGYQGRYDEMREKMTYVTGDYFDKLAFYLNFRKFDTAPALNSDFIACVPDEDIFAVVDEPPFLANFYFPVKALRPIPLVSEPGLVDHVYGA